MQGKTKMWDTLIAKIKGNKKLEIAIYVALGLAAVLKYVSTIIPKSPEEPKDNDVVVSEVSVSTESGLEERLAKTLSGIKGVGRVEVMITYETTSRLVPAMSTDTQQNSSSGSDGSESQTNTESSSPATISKNGGNEPIVLTEVQPLVRGVIVVAEGAEDIAVKLNLQYAVKTVLGIDDDCIEVFEMEQ